MILQGLFNILDLYLDDIDLFYQALDQFFWEELRRFFGEKSIHKEEFFKESLKDLPNNSNGKEDLYKENLNLYKPQLMKDKQAFQEILNNVFKENHKNPRILRRERRNLKRQNKLAEWKQKKEEWRYQKEKLRRKRDLKNRMKKKEYSRYMNELMNNVEEALLSYLENEFVSLGFKKQQIATRFMDPFLQIKQNENNIISSPFELYKKKIAPILYEIFLEKIADYLVDIDAATVLINLKSRGYLPIEFMMELRNLKENIEKSGKTENLKKFIHIRENVIQKFRQNKEKIEGLQNLEDPRDKLQIVYLIFRIINFFNLETLFDFTPLKNYIKNNINEWLESLPLVTLKNPDLYYCGIYLAKHLHIKIDNERVKNYLKDLYDENIDEFEAPIIEATDRLYYFLKSTSLIKWRLSEEQILRLIRADANFFKPANLKNLETSQLVVILKLYNFLGIIEKVNPQNPKGLIEELNLRITSEGIKQFRDGIVSSEATYYVLFCNYMRNCVENLKSVEFLNMIVSRIYRNLEILDFSQNVNYDLISEIFYSIESLKLFNCIETKEMIIHLVKYLFPKEVIEKIRQREEIGRSSAEFRHFKVDRVTGETIY